jgi:hypothetical protein
MANWHEHNGKWWMIQWCFDWWLSIGVHIDLKPRRVGKEGPRYGPYIVLHLGMVILYFGVNPRDSLAGIQGQV